MAWREKRAARDDYLRHACCGSELPVTASKHEKTVGNPAITARGKSTMLSDSDKSTCVWDNTRSISKRNDPKLQRWKMSIPYTIFGLKAFRRITLREQYKNLIVSLFCGRRNFEIRSTMNSAELNVNVMFTLRTLNLKCRLRAELEVSRQPVTFQENREKRDFVTEIWQPLFAQNARTIVECRQLKLGSFAYTGLEEVAGTKTV